MHDLYISYFCVQYSTQKGWSVSIMWPKQSGQRFADDISKVNKFNTNFHCKVQLSVSPFDTKSELVNSLAPGTFELHFRHVLFKQILVIDGWGISCQIALLWISLNFTDDQSTLVQVMAWCHQATSHYLIQCWPRYLLPYGVTRPQWVEVIALGWTGLKPSLYEDPSNLLIW